MKIERRGAQWKLNGYALSGRLLKSILDEFFVKEIRAEIHAAIERDGYAECEITAWHDEPSTALKRANKKIAAFEAEIGRQAVQNIYRRLS